MRLAYTIEKSIIQRCHFCICKKVRDPIIRLIPFRRPETLKLIVIFDSKTHLKSKSPKKSLICWSKLLAKAQLISIATMHVIFAANICDNSEKFPILKISTRRFDIKMLKSSPFIPLVMFFINFYYIILKWILYHF